MWKLIELVVGLIDKIIDRVWLKPKVKATKDVVEMFDVIDKHQKKRLARKTARDLLEHPPADSNPK